jgi:hypothetical protein
MLRSNRQVAQKNGHKYTTILKALAIAAPFLLITASRADDLHVIKKWKDVQLYVKPKFNGISQWDQEVGVQAKLLCYGRFSEVTNAAIDPTYPIRFDSKPRFTVGLAFGYQLLNDASKLTVYTKPKASPLPYTWKEESGFSVRLYTSRFLNINTNAAYVFNLPFHQNAKPQWLGLVNFQFPLG